MSGEPLKKALVPAKKGFGEMNLQAVIADGRDVSFFQAIHEEHLKKENPDAEKAEPMPSAAEIGLDAAQTTSSPALG